MVQAINQQEKLYNFNRDTKYVYFGRDKKNNKHKGVTCVGYKIDDSGTVLRLAVAFCSPEDTFTKKESHVRINARINSDAYEDLIKDIEEISPDNPLFFNITHEKIINLIILAINSTIPANWENYKSYLSNKKVYPKFARIKLPKWFTNIK
jgi:hypothetical protein